MQTQTAEFVKRPNYADRQMKRKANAYRPKNKHTSYVESQEPRLATESTCSSIGEGSTGQPSPPTNKINQAVRLTELNTSFEKQHKSQVASPKESSSTTFDLEGGDKHSQDDVQTVSGTTADFHNELAADSHSESGKTFNFEGESSQQPSVCNSRRPSFALTEADETNLEVGSGFNKNVKAFKPFNPNAVSFKPFVPSAAPKKEAQPAKTSGLNAIESLSQTKDFTPSTPHVHKFRTELCKNFQLYGTCKYGDECSFAHGNTRMMIKTDVSMLYKTKLCKKFSTNGYCPYGMRCQFIHEFQSEQKPAAQVQVLEQKVNPAQVSVEETAAKIEPEQAKKVGELIQQATGTGGFGNQQAMHALEKESIIYRDILVHNMNCSVQEYQKKQKMYQKKVSKRKQDQVSQPDFCYMNIHKQQTNRLSCFTDMVEEEYQNEEEKFYYFHGNATAYENHLDFQIRHASSFEVAQPQPQQYQGGYQTSFSLGTVPFQPQMEQLTHMSLTGQVGFAQNAPAFVPTI